MLLPKKTKYKKKQRGRLRGLAGNGTSVSFGDYGLQALEGGFVTDRQIEAARRVITRYIKRGGKVWIRIFPDKPISELPAETRMGKGKGDLKYWAAPVKRGKILFELAGVSEEVARRAFQLAGFKLPLKKLKFKQKESVYVA